MTDWPDKNRDVDINALVDGELDAAARAEVQAWLDASPQAAKSAADYRAISAALHDAFDSVVDEPVPPALVRAARRVHPRRWRRWAGGAVAASILLVLGAAGGWTLRGLDGPDGAADGLPPAYVRSAINAHQIYVPERRHPVEVWADETPHLTAWLSNRLGAPISAPPLGDDFELIGGRLLSDQGLPAAQLMYEVGDGTRLTVFVTPDGGTETAFQFTASGGISALYWTSGPFAYVVAGQMSREQLAAVARRILDELSGLTPG